MAWIVPQPSDLTNPIKVADWLELIALVADDGNASAGDIEQIFRREGTYDRADGSTDQRIDAQILTVLAELTKREKNNVPYYPFSLRGRLLTRAAAFDEKYLPYLFCLCISYFDHGKSAKHNGIDPRMMFESLSACALRGYIGGDVKVFGTSRLPANAKGKGAFQQAIHDLCTFVGEGGTHSSAKVGAMKDDHVDLVSVKHFSDQLPGKLIIFGQCASGNNWDGKTREMDPNAFWGTWMQEQSVSTLGRSFFIPHRITADDWDYYVRRAGILFDRTRLAHWSNLCAQLQLLASDLQRWMQGCLLQHLKVAQA